MSVLSETGARVGERNVTLGEMFQTMKMTGTLSMLNQVLIEIYGRDVAKARDIAVSDADLQAAADAFRQSNGLQSAADMMQWLEQAGQSVETFEEGLEHGIILSRLQDAIVTDDEIEKRFLAERTGLEEASLSQIVADTAGRAAEIRDQIEDGEMDFVEAAQQYSADETGRRAAGHIGWISRSALPDEVKAKVFAASPDDVLGPIVFEGQHVLLKVWETRAPTLDDGLRARLAAAVYADWIGAKFDEGEIALTLPA